MQDQLHIGMQTPIQYPSHIAHIASFGERGCLMRHHAASYLALDQPRIQLRFLCVQKIDTSQSGFSERQGSSSSSR